MADLIAFPQDRNVGKARHVAALWLQRHAGAERDSYWKLVTKRYTETMERVGLSDYAIRAELRGFKEAVEDQILLIQQRTEQHVLDAATDFVGAHRVIDNNPSRGPSRDASDPGAA